MVPFQSLRQTSFFLFLLLVPALFLLDNSTLYATEKTTTEEIPAQLQPWVPWVLHDQEQKTCTLRSDSRSVRYCSWPSRLDLHVADKGATFNQRWLVEIKTQVILPGNKKIWPDQVTINDKNTPVIELNGKPAIWLEPGNQMIKGSFSWQTIPEYLPIDPGSGLVKLWLNGNKVDRVKLERDGRLWLQKKAEKTAAAQDKIHLRIFRKIKDSIPITQKLRIMLTVSGSPREIPLGLVLDDPFIPLSVNSRLPVRIDKANRLLVQAKPGQWQIQLTLRSTEPQPPVEIGRGKIAGQWPNQEIWVFQAVPSLRQVTIQGVSTIDPSQTDIPDDWKKFPSYLLSGDTKMNILEKFRGNPNPVPDQLAVKRTMWLDEKGSGLTAQDLVTGTMSQGWRLEVVPEQDLGQVQVNGRRRMITRVNESGLEGVEVRQGNIQVTADSRIKHPVSAGRLNFPASGWNHHIQNLAIDLNLPPGWKLLSATGVDKIKTWVTSWSLFDIFLVLIIAMVTVKIINLPTGFLTLVTLILIYHQPGAPRILWLPLLAFLALHGLLKKGWPERISRWTTSALLIILILMAIPYMVKEIRVGLYPQLEFGNYYSVSQPSSPVPAKQAMDSAAPPMPMQAMEYEEAKNLEAKGKSIKKPGRGRNTLYSSLPGSSWSKNKYRASQYDPEANVQTGPGLPNWRFRTVSMQWRGPVKPDQQVQLILLSPVITCILGFVRVFLLALLLILFIRQIKINISAGKKTAKVAAFLLMFTCAQVLPFATASVQAEMPSETMLTELQKRVLQSPECSGNCASIDSMRLTIKDEQLVVGLSLHSLVETAVYLPGNSRSFNSILLDGQVAVAIRQDNNQRLLIRVPAGIHQVILKKDINGRQAINLSFPLLPHQAATDISDWDITGIHEDGTMDSQITMVKHQPKDKSQSQYNTILNEDQGIQLAPFFQVVRTLIIDKKWRVETTIIRHSPGNTIIAAIPLLPGELVTTESLHMENKKVEINMGPKQNRLTWTSVLNPVATLLLKAPKTSQWVETWHLDISPVWHVTTSGLPVVSQTNKSGLRFPEYRPRPGESLTLAFNKPQAVPGPTITIDASTLTVKPGLRSTESSLKFSLTAGRGSRHTIKIPEHSIIQTTTINGKDIGLQPDGNTITFPVRPGKQEIVIGWRSDQGIETRFTTPQIELGQEHVNAAVKLEMPYSRWILWVGGPRIGPAVLFWGELVVIILLAILLGRIRMTPLGTIQWFLLGLGLSQVSSPVAALVAGWLLLLGLRKTKFTTATSTIGFNAMQIFLGFATLCAMIALLYAIQHGLLGNPDMQIGGNGSSGHSLSWYQDRNGTLFPQAWVLSVPLFIYRIAMLIWALWLAFALMRWLRWGWGCFTTETIWKMNKKRPMAFRKPVPPAEPPATATTSPAVEPVKPESTEPKEQEQQGKADTEES